MSGEELQPHELMQIVADFLEEHAIAYRVVDLIARMACGEPRLTIDINMVADLKLNHVELICKTFAAPNYFMSESTV